MRVAGIPEGASARGERGAALIVTMVTVMVAASLSLALLLVATGRQRSTQARRGMEAALAVAEAGLARGRAEANLIANRSDRHYPAAGPGVTLTGTSAEVRDAESPTAVMGRFVVTLQSGLSDGRDNDGDGTIDEDDHDPRDPIDGLDNDGDGLVDLADTSPADPNNPGENNYIILVSTGYFGPVAESNPNKVRVTGQIFVERNIFSVFGALAVGGASPTLAISSSSAFKVSGLDHDDDSNDIYAPGDVNDNGDPTPGLPGVSITDSTYTDVPVGSLDLAAHPPPPPPPQDPTVVGSTPYELNQPASPIADMVAWAKANATFSTAGLLPNNFDYSTVVYHEGTQTVTGNTYGAGIWVVNGDLVYGGNAQFRGIMIVTGNVTIIGGGSNYLVKGALIVGGNATTDFSNNGTTDIRYSSEAVTNAQNSSVYYSMVSWMQISTNP